MAHKRTHTGERPFSVIYFITDYLNFLKFDIFNSKINSVISATINVHILMS